MASDVEVAVLSSDGVESSYQKIPARVLWPRIPTTLTPLEEVVEIEGRRGTAIRGIRNRQVAS